MGGFWLEWYVVAFNNAAVQDATARSIIIALWASVISTTAATMAALCTTRRVRFRGQTVISTIFNQPLMVPGVIAGAMLAFIISLDNVIITEFVKSAGQDTLPTYMLGQLRRALTPEVNAISTALLALTVLILIAFVFVIKKRA